jgi:hypothetical protein
VSPDSPITAQSLREIFAKTVLCGRLKMPGEAELKELACILEYRRGIFQAEQIWLHRRKLQQTALTALKTLSDAVFKIAELDKNNLIAATNDAVAVGALRELSALAAESDDIYSIIERIGLSPGLLHSPIGYPEEAGYGWRTFCRRISWRQ